jgi:hypothetical protein
MPRGSEPVRDGEAEEGYTKQRYGRTPISHCGLWAYPAGLHVISDA